MIVSDRYEFIFVHIPKCAGSSVRRALEAFDDMDGYFSRSVGVDAAGNEVDYTHLPLRALAEIEPDVLGRFSTHESFAVVRDPVVRFQSAMNQRAKMYLGNELAQMPQGELEAEVDRVIAHLEERPYITDPAFIHFSRQSDYIALDGVRMVSRVFPIEAVGDLERALEVHLGVELDMATVNETKVMRFPKTAGVVRRSKTAVDRVLPEYASRVLRARMRRMLLRSSGGDILPALRSARVREFIAHHYRDDIALHKALLEEKGA